MKTTIFILVILLCFLQGSIIHAEQHTIKYVAEDYSGGIYASPYPITGTVTFEDTPAPLTPVRVRFQIEPNAQREKFASDLSLSVVYDTTSVRIVGDTSWPAGTLKGEFSVIPLKSGYHGFAVGYRDSHDGRFVVRWCLSPIGEMSFIGQDYSINHQCDGSWCVFFDTSVVVKEALYNEPRASKLFNYVCTFDTIPQVGDTAELTMELTFLQDAMEGVNMHVDSRGYEIVSPPERLDRPIRRDETVRLLFKLRPEDCQCVHSLIFSGKANGDDYPFWHRFALNAVFDDTGVLRCITDRAAGPEMKALLGGDYMNEYLRGTTTVLHISAEGSQKDRKVVLDEKERMRIMEQK